MFNHRSLYFWSYAGARRVGKAEGDVTVMIFAYTTNGNIHDFLVATLLKTTHAHQEVPHGALPIERCDAFRPD